MFDYIMTILLELVRTIRLITEAYIIKMKC